VIDLPPFDAVALSLHHSPGVHAILVGSGLSRAAGIPTGWEITIDLIRRLAALGGVTEHNDWVQWYRDEHSGEPSYSEILAALASTSIERRAILQGYIDPREGDDIRKPTKAHHAIARLVASGAVRVVITTNFDRLIENALREAGVEPTVIAGDDAIAGATPLIHSKCTVIKVHGDYLDARIKNTDAELEEYSPAMNALLDQVFDNFGLLVVGWSGEGIRRCELPFFAPLLGDTHFTGPISATLAGSRKTSWNGEVVGASRSQTQTACL
jgi:SIR2-like domain